MRIVENNKYEIIGQEIVEQTETPSKEEPSENSSYDEEEINRKLKAEEMEKQGKLQQAENQYQSVMNKLNSIEELGKKSEELQWQIRKKSYVPRKAREAREEKDKVDKELEAEIKRLR